MRLRAIKITLVCVAFFLAVFGCATGVDAHADNANRETYVYCNVYLSTLCFGIASGDELKMTIPIDYVRYEIKFSDNRNAIVYSGHNPHIENSALEKKFAECVLTKKTCAFSHISKTSFEAIYSQNRQEGFVHVVMTDISPSNQRQANEFAENFRPCERNVSNLTCRDQQVFSIRN